jgi:hypothetical protein
MVSGYMNYSTDHRRAYSCGEHDYYLESYEDDENSYVSIIEDGSTIHTRRFPEAFIKNIYVSSDEHNCHVATVLKSGGHDSILILQLPALEEVGSFTLDESVSANYISLSADGSSVSVLMASCDEVSLNIWQSVDNYSKPVSVAELGRYTYTTSSKCQHVSSGGSLYVSHKSGIMRVDLESGDLFDVISWNGIRWYDVSSKDNAIAIVDSAGRISIWDMHNKSSCIEMLNTTFSLLNICFSPSGEYIAVSGSYSNNDYIPEIDWDNKRLKVLPERKYPIAIVYDNVLQEMQRMSGHPNSEYYNIQFMPAIPGLLSMQDSKSGKTMTFRVGAKTPEQR